MRKYTNMVLNMLPEGMSTMSAEDVAKMCLAYMSEDDVKDMCRANDLFPEDEESNPIREMYDKCMCPDCGEDIPQDAEEGGMCENCGHVWGGSAVDDDGQPDEAQEWESFDVEC